MSRRGQATNQNTNQAQEQQRERWVKTNSDFAGEVFDRFDILEQSMNTKMENLEQSMNTKMENLEKSMNTKMENLESSMNKQMEDIKDSIKTFKKSFTRKAIGILFSDNFENE